MKILLKSSCILLLLNSLVAPIAIGQANAPVALRSMAQLRSITPTDTATLYYIMQKGKEGIWRYDATDMSSADNTGTVIVTAGGKRLKRLISDGVLQLNWFNVYAD